MKCRQDYKLEMFKLVYSCSYKGLVLAPAALAEPVSSHARLPSTRSVPDSTLQADLLHWCQFCKSLLLTINVCATPQCCNLLALGLVS